MMMTLFKILFDIYSILTAYPKRVSVVVVVMWLIFSVLVTNLTCDVYVYQLKVYGRAFKQVNKLGKHTDAINRVPNKKGKVS